MKRSLPASKLSAPVEPKWNYQDDILASSLMLVTIAEGSPNGRFPSKSSCGNMSSASRSCSGGTLNGSIAPSKSYKVDLCSMDHPINEKPLKRNSEPVSMDIDDAGGDDWGFFVDSL